MSVVRESYLVAAESAVALLSDPAVARRWAEPSALPEFSVGGLAAHLAGQILFVTKVLRDPAPGGEVVSLLGHYGKVTWIGADLDAEVNATIRRSGEQQAAEGAVALVERTAAAVGDLRRELADQPADRLVHPPAGPWALRLDDFLVTRMMEIAVHSDDLACSVDVPTPQLPASVLDPVFGLLLGLAVNRHGATAVLRALSRAERAPSTIAGI